MATRDEAESVRAGMVAELADMGMAAVGGATFAGYAFANGGLLFLAK